MRPHGRARVSLRNSRAFAICDRCGFLYNHSSLGWQYDWRGTALQNLKMLVCRRCTDVPQEQLRAIVVPADPTPVINARVQDYQTAETDNLTVSAPTVYDPLTGIVVPPTTILSAQDGTNLTAQVTGSPGGLEPGAIMPLLGKITYGRKLPVLSVIANNTTVVTVTCSAAHGLVTNDQVSIEGLSNNLAHGFYSVNVTTATAFNYEASSVIKTGSLLQGTTLVQTVIVGLPYNYTQIPLLEPYSNGGNAARWINNSGAVIPWVNSSNNPIPWV